MTQKAYINYVGNKAKELYIIFGDEDITKYFGQYDIISEPFAGSCIFSIVYGARYKHGQFIVSDLDDQLIEFYRALKNNELNQEDYESALEKHGWDTIEKRQHYNEDKDINETYKYIFWTSNMYPLYDPKSLKPLKSGAPAKPGIYIKKTPEGPIPHIRTPVLFKGKRDDYFLNNMTAILQDYKLTLKQLQDAYEGTDGVPKKVLCFLDPPYITQAILYKTNFFNVDEYLVMFELLASYKFDFVMICLDSAIL